MKMMKRIFLATISIALASPAIFGADGLAQDEKPKTVSIDSCMRYALENSFEVQSAEWEARGAKGSRTTALGDLLPTVTASVSGQYNWGKNINAETNTYSTETNFNNSYNLYGSMTLFDGGRTFNSFRQAVANKKSAGIALQKAKEDKQIDVMQKYVDAVYAHACVRLSADKLADSKHLLTQTRRQEELGIKSVPDVAQIEAQVAEDEYNHIHQRNVYDAAMLALKSSMNFPLSEELQLDTTLVAVEPEYRLESSGDIFDFASVNSTAAQIAALSTRSAMFDYRMAQGYFYPTLSLSGGVYSNYYTVPNSAAEAASFSSQFKNNMGEYIGLSLSIPIFNLSYYGNLRRQKASYRKAQIEEQQTLRQLHDDIAQAIMDRNGYAVEIDQMVTKQASDSLSYSLARRKYEEGMLNAYDLRTSSNTLLESRITLLQMRLLYVIKDRLVDYYKGIDIIRKEN